MCGTFPAFPLGPTPLKRVPIGLSSPVVPSQIFARYPVILMETFSVLHPVHALNLESCPYFAVKSQIPSYK